MSSTKLLRIYLLRHCLRNRRVISLRRHKKSNLKEIESSWLKETDLKHFQVKSLKAFFSYFQ